MTRLDGRSKSCFASEENGKLFRTYPRRSPVTRFERIQARSMSTSVWKLAESIMSPNAVVGVIDYAERREERAWLDRCALGDEKAIRWVLDRYRDRVVRLAGHVLHNSREAEDVAQEAFVKAFRQIGQFRGESGFYAWLYRIVVNLCLDRMRRKSVTSELPFEETLPLAVAVSPDIEKRLAVEQVLNSLTVPMRAALGGVAEACGRDAAKGGRQNDNLSLFLAHRDFGGSREGRK